ncbi:NAD-dependent succinate-semialdehyde dehydrogenase [Schinkia azotoformans]|uniref:NAD-dependent succinate-semialdehyde dehydrogenase n=1 Tax=Schinkia azotoformans TaxID=1454 RepID=UPI002DBBE445|nr:NAD-dependent succinate-semialdehyde dehydrogenase [Schinkia azotoformans]MEC1717294.1 NAD-dependent succinate-semialdehyde dehydrogenase [Schinkia azotoformans]MEC1739326.1 NAD-dependent succinate-semialdehyde dehydrogenase [Schinkia azotoformans]MEC1747668.1 NAD-dependent succinate-semialdehyde dehydrogenase [Schinkia azotoformans]MEC1760195.1 NAD-dependent succinate-semialdehyde dehydrogenase [Schinkia azotoformans]MEC1764971.1 NAD-dependent succinate-semialdehyde dehydrogenase [Schinkia
MSVTGQVQQYDMYINGKWVGSESGDVIDVINPATNEVVATVPKGGTTEAKLAVDAAYNALQEWSKKTADERGRLLMNWFNLIDQNKEEIGKIMTMEQGKPVKEAVGEMNYANSFISWYAEEGKRIYGETIPASHPDKRILVRKEPVGVVAAITPWNFPAAMITRKVAPALAAGCTAVVKPATQTPLTALKMAEYAEKAGIPKGVINIVIGKSNEIGETWLNDSRVRKITFTGSTEVGKTLMRGAAENVKKISLELGGNAPFIVMDDANLEKAAKGLMASKFRNAGQTCICTNRIYVQESIKDQFVEIFKNELSKLKVGNGLEEGTDIGPLIDQAAVNKVKELLDDAVEKGGNIVYSGETPEASDGYYFNPTIITNVQDDMLCVNEEIFGPLASILTFTTEEEVIQRANNTVYGLSAYVYTENLSRAIRISEQLEYGIIGLNDGLPSTAQAPFGGYKESGLGREGGHFGIEEFLEVKYISIAL